VFFTTKDSFENRSIIKNGLCSCFLFTFENNKT
jgi:hypothetical protein